jgi:hypothetical protein
MTAAFSHVNARREAQAVLQSALPIRALPALSRRPLPSGFLPWQRASAPSLGTDDADFDTNMPDTTDSENEGGEATDLADARFHLPLPPSDVSLAAAAQQRDLATPTRIAEFHGIDVLRARVREYIGQTDTDTTAEEWTPGENVVCISLDSGLDAGHDAFSDTTITRITAHLRGTELDGRVAGTRGTRVDLPRDQVGHGSLAASVVSSHASGVEFYDLPIFGPAGTTTGQVILNAYQWILNNIETITNNGEKTVVLSGHSFGTSETIPAIDDRHNRLVAQAGVRDVAAAGNAGPDPVSGGSPATASNALSVGACTLDGDLASFSASNVSAGITNPDVSAVGVRVVGAQARGTRMGQSVTPDAPPTKRRTASSGTSFSRPICTAVLAIVASIPDLDTPTATEMLTLLRETSRDLAGTERDGAGIIDGAAIAESIMPDKTEDSQDDSTEPVVTTEAEARSWDFGPGESVYIDDDLLPSGPLVAKKYEDGSVRLIPVR